MKNQILHNTPPIPNPLTQPKTITSTADIHHPDNSADALVKSSRPRVARRRASSRGAGGGDLEAMNPCKPKGSSRARAVPRSRLDETSSAHYPREDYWGITRGFLGVYLYSIAPYNPRSARRHGDIVGRELRSIALRLM